MALYTLGSGTRKLKLEWVKQNYGVSLKDSCIWEGEIKAEKIKEYGNTNGLRYDQVLFVDDDFRNLELATNAGIQTCCPIEVVNFMCEFEDCALRCEQLLQKL